MMNAYFVFAGPLNQDKSELDVPTITADSGNIYGSLLWVIVSLLLVIGLIIIVLKFLSQRSQGIGLNRSVKTLGGVALGQNKSLQVIELAGKIYIVGVGEDITLLDKIESSEEADFIIALMEQQASRGLTVSNVKDMFTKLRQRNKEKQPDNEPWNPPDSFQDLLQEKLQRQSQQKQRVEQALNNAKQTDRLMDE